MTRVAETTATGEQRAARRKALLRAGAELEKGVAAAAVGKGGKDLLEVHRLRQAAESALAHAEADARDAGHTIEIESAVVEGRLYLVATHPVTRKRRAWAAGRIRPAK